MLTHTSRRNVRRFRSLKSVPASADVEFLETRTLMSATGDFPASARDALDLLVKQENRQLTVDNSIIKYGNEPIRLVGYGDYGMLSEKDFDFDRFFQRAEQSGVNFVRVFLQYQWTGKDGLSPFSRDSNGKYDITKLNEDYFNRLDSFLSSAETRGIVVQLALFDIITLEDGDLRWNKSPFNTDNQQKGKQYPLSGNNGKSRLASFNQSKLLWDDSLMPLIDRTVTATSTHGNVILEVMNEPEGDSKSGNVSFHENVIDRIRSLNKKVPVSVNVHGDADLETFALDKKKVDIIAVHARSRDKDPSTSVGQDKELKSITDIVAASSKPVIISNDGDLTQLNPARSNQSSSDGVSYKNTDKGQERVSLLGDMLKATFAKDATFGHAHFEILDKGLNGNTWLSSDYEVAHDAYDQQVLNLLAKSSYVNQNPVAKNDRFRMRQDVSKAVNLVVNRKDASLSDKDADSDQIRIVAVTPGSREGGSVQIIKDGQNRLRVNYTPARGFSGSDTFWYMISDGRGGRDVAKVTINVRTTQIQKVGVGQVSRILPAALNDELPENILGLSQPRSGVVSLNKDNSLVYTPNPGFAGIDEFSYAVDDGDGGIVYLPVSVAVVPAIVADGVLRIVGTSLNNQIRISGSSTVRVEMDGQKFEFARAGIRQILVEAGAGNDMVRNDTSLPMEAYGESGNDTIYGGVGIDRIYGGEGADRLFGGDSLDWLYGGNGNDYISGGAGDDRMEGGDGNDEMVGDEGNDLMNGGAGDDVLYGNGGNDRLNGDRGNDYLDGGRGDDELDGHLDAWWLSRDRRFAGWIRG